MAVIKKYSNWRAPGQEWEQLDHVLGDFILDSTETMRGKLYKILVYYCIRDDGYIPSLQGGDQIDTSV